MEITNLKLGITQKELIDKTKEHLEALYTQNEAQNNDITTAQKKANDAFLLASQKRKVVSYDTLDIMINALNNAVKTDFNIGDEIYIKDTKALNDYWVSDVTENKVDNNTSIEDLNSQDFKSGAVGHFELSRLDLAPEVTNMVTSDENITEDKIVLGAGNKKVKGSGYLIATTLDNSDSKVPTSSAVANAISNIGTETSPVGYATRAIQDENGNVISTTYATQADLANAGKVKGVALNGTEIELDENGIANIDLSDISVDVEELGTDIKQATLINYPSNNDVQYKAIQMPKTSVVIEVLKKEDNADEYLSVVTQSIVVGEFTYYLLDKSATGNYYYREVGGNAVSGGSGNSDSSLPKRQFYFDKKGISVTAYSDEAFEPTIIEIENMTFNGKTGVDAFIAKRGDMLDKSQNPQEGYVFYHYSGATVTKTYLDGGVEKTIEIYKGYWKITELDYDIEYVLSIPTKLSKDLDIDIKGFFVYQSSNTKTDYDKLSNWLGQEFSYTQGADKYVGIGTRYCEIHSTALFVTFSIVIAKEGMGYSYMRVVFYDEKDTRWYFDILCSNIKTKVISIA